MTIYAPLARQIQPDGQITSTSRNVDPSSPYAKNISLNPSGKSALSVRPVPPEMRAFRDRHERAAGCGGREGCD
jgi:hypothetical protein